MILNIVKHSLTVLGLRALILNCFKRCLVRGKLKNKYKSNLLLRLEGFPLGSKPAPVVKELQQVLKVTDLIKSREPNTLMLWVLLLNLSAQRCKRTLTRYVSEGIAAGVEDGGTEGISELNEILGGDQEALKLYISLDIEDGELDQAKEIAAQLKYIKDEIPPNMMVAFGIDIKNPDHYEKLMDPEFVDRLALVSQMVETLPEEEKTLSAKFAFDIEDPNGEPMTTKDFLNQWKGIQSKLADLDGVDSVTNMTALVDIVTEINGTPN